MPKEVGQRAQRAIGEKVFPGCVIGVVRASGEREVQAFGTLTYETASADVGEDTIYDLASVTKSIPVASLAAMLVAEGKLQLSDKVIQYIPELKNDHGATIEDLLRYRVRGPRMSTLEFPTFEQVRTYMLETGFQGPSGGSEYANAPAFFLGMVLEKIDGMLLTALAHKYFFGPLEMKNTTFFPHDIGRIAPTEIENGKEIRGIVHDESARLFAVRRRAVGHAGLFSTAPDLLNFLEALLRQKVPPVLDAAQQGLGWQRKGELLGSRASDLAFGKTGFTGSSVAVDPRKEVGFVILSNRTYPKRPRDSAAINSFRAEIADSIFSS